MIPRKVQVLLRRIRARRIFKQQIPPYIHPDHSEYGWSWPYEHHAAVLLTHDVETAKGQDNVSSLMELEHEKGVVSSWNFVTRRYDVDMGLLSSMRSKGHEIGVHGVLHDGKLFSSKQVFRSRIEEAISAAEEWGANGFRSPSLLYREDLLRELPFRWDSSIPAWDPFQPQPGGSGRYYPYLLSETCVELPVTLWQDFTLFEELQQKDISIWKTQADAIYEMGGLINIIVHPDYMNEQRLKLYRELLKYLQSKQNIWFVLPSEIAEWIQSIT